MIRTDREVKLLLACSKPQMDGENEQRICRLLQEEINWGWMQKAARVNGIWPIMYHNLKSVCPNAVPKDILLNLKNVYLNNAMRNLMLTKELLRIIEDFQENGIEAVPFKGPTLAKKAYGDVTLRSFSDLDIMVRKHDVLKAKDVLLIRGYKPQIMFSPRQEKGLLKNACEYNFFRKNPSIAVEIHWRFHPEYCSVPFDEGIWSRLDHVDLEGTQINSFTANDMILILSSHATRHEWSQLKFMSDLAGIISRHQINWDQVASGANEMRIVRILHLGLLLAHDLLGAELPKQTLYEAESDDAAWKIAHSISEKLFSDLDRPDGIIEKYLFWAKARERLSDQARYIFDVGIKPSQADYDAFPMPELFYPAYWVVRPVRLVWQYVLKKQI
jgi:hypothetical protein